MISSISYKIAKILYENDEEKSVGLDMYRYGLELLISSFVNILAIIGLSCILGCIMEMLLYILFFAVLRISAGGYHAPTHFKCLFIYSIISFTFVQLLRIVDQSGFSMPVILSACVIAFMLVYKYAPVDSENKPLSPDENRLYKKRSRQAVIVQVLVILVLAAFGRDQYIYILSCAGGMFAESITLLPILNEKGGNAYENK